jgi:hexosaminidase
MRETARTAGFSTALRWGLALLLYALPIERASAQPALIPLPTSVEWRDGEFRLTTQTTIEGRGAAQPVAAYLKRVFAFGAENHTGSMIRLRIARLADPSNREAYHLRVDARGVLIEASTSDGLFNGAQTLRQLVTTAPNGSRSVPAVEIRDAPRFHWRGLLIDVSRHFFGKPTILKILDEMATYKLNVLQLHLSDDPGWRLEIPRYPKLTEVGALDSATGTRQYFTAADIRDIVAYAAERHIIVVPEIEMPGHSGSEARAYPEFFDRQGRFNPGKPQTYDFIHGVLSEVSRLFPGPYIHFGGDEVGDDAWKDLPDVARLKAERHLTSTKDVESYFSHRVANIIRDLGKRPMAWDEQAEAGADKNVVIFWWRKGRPDVLKAAAKSGYDLVLSPVDQVYFDYPQGPGEPGAPWEGNDNGPTSISKILAWEPIPADFTSAEAAKVLGVEAAVWTEFIRSDRYLEFMTFPRLLAFAEVAWRPRGPRDEQEFDNRLQPHIAGLRTGGINARRESGDAFEFMTN